MIYKGITIISSQRLELKLLKHSETCILIGNGYKLNFKAKAKAIINSMIGKIGQEIDNIISLDNNMELYGNSHNTISNGNHICIW